ncbi:hypothetical protein A4R35_09715 [Thermogemmatispora tikiterensis]|uniref:VOC domain-containing protein n=2 Tax=Thermogemmatispora tikiterensis TaxID=1825093 RepID=A0A328VI85_9CHLR|nr:hypothetical protein A4R35_09715 [Thermogemmatispora tikiterensis]
MTQQETVTVKGLDFVSLQVRDLEASRRFYTEVLGFEALPQDRPESVVFRTEGGAVFALRVLMVDLDAVTRLGWGVGLWFATPNVEALHERVVNHGGKVVKPLADGPFGRLFVVADPDGYQITFHQAD